MWKEVKSIPRMARHRLPETTPWKSHATIIRADIISFAKSEARLAEVDISQFDNITQARGIYDTNNKRIGRPVKVAIRNGKLYLAKPDEVLP